MKDYRVIWEIDVTAENPEEAAKLARHYQTMPGTTADVFDVHGIDGSHRVDLTEGTVWEL